MIDYPRLRVRPYSTQTCQIFRGLDRQPGASSRTRNKSWHMGWHDELNLSADRSPRMSVRLARGRVDKIDDNVLRNAVIAMSGGDHALILDAAGNLWCNGHSVYLAGQDGLTYSWRASSASGLTISPSNGETGAVPDADRVQSVLWDAWSGNRGRATLIYDPENAPGAKRWHFVEGDTWVTMEELQLSALHVNTLFPGITRGPRQGDTITVDFYVACVFGDSPTIIRMGSDAVIYPGWIWCNAVKLGAGDELVYGEDYGPCEGLAQLMTGESALTLTLCDINGKPYSNALVSDTEPTQDGMWLDTSGAVPVLREWSISQSMWESIPTTYIKIDKLEQEPLLDTLRKGDAVTATVDCAAETAEDVVKLLNSEHYIYDADLTDPGGGWIMISGILPSQSVTVRIAAQGAVRFARKMPTVDFLIEAQNRLWACRYSEQDGINEIYASKLGDFRNWSVYQGMSTDSWSASRGTAAPFTGAITIGGNPLFFREDSVEKIYPSSTGAHAIVTHSIEGVQQGSHGSMVVIDDRLYYKSRMSVCVYGGTLPVRISDELGDWQFSRATAARHKRKYVICMTRSDGVRRCMVYDLQSGDWHVEDDCWDGIAVTWEDNLYYVADGDIYLMDGGAGSGGVAWSAETDEMSLELPEHKWVSYLRLRYTLALGATCRVYMSYDGGPWERKTALHGNTQRSAETSIWPRRCDHFRLRLEGTGGFELQSISYRVERSQGGH